GGLRIIAICCADPLAPCTNGRFSGWTASEVLLPMNPPKVVGETVVEVFFQVATLVCVPAAGIPPLQLANGTLNFRQFGLNAGFVAVAILPLQPPVLLSTRSRRISPTAVTLSSSTRLLLLPSARNRLPLVCTRP